MVDPGNTARRAMAYDRMLMLYWVNIKKNSHSSLTMATKQEGDKESVKPWKEHNVDCCLMHKKNRCHCFSHGHSVLSSSVRARGGSWSVKDGKSARHHAL